jgi:hypothetical integral membrane protein (TIGR02206 family)
MPDHLRLFGLVHLIILAAVPLLAATLAAVQRRLGPGARGIRYGLATLLFLCFVLYYGYFALQGEQMFPNHMPLELCDASLWLVIVALLTLKPAVFDLAYYYALAGASMSLLTPILTETSPLFVSMQYFCDHGLIVVSVLYLVWSGQARPRMGSVGRAMLALNIYAVFVGTFDALCGTNYMYLRAKPQTDSLLTIFGPWPWYIVVSELVGLFLFMLLYLPFRGQPTPFTEPSPLPAQSTAQTD